jgi:hypothetical protein
VGAKDRAWHLGVKLTGRNAVKFLDFPGPLDYILILRQGKVMTVDEIKERIKAAAPEGRIACAAAFRLADELGLSRKEMGELLNELRIKITNCQMGCF